MNREVTAEEIANARRSGFEMLSRGAGFFYARRLDDGRVLYLAGAQDWPSRVIKHDRIRLGIARDGAVHAYYAFWDYPVADDDAERAWRAVLGWDGNEEPPDGWLEHHAEKP